MQYRLTKQTKEVNKMEIQVKVKNVYGVEKIYPACEKAQCFANIAKSKTLTTETLYEIYKLGYDIVVENTVFKLSDLIAFN